MQYTAEDIKRLEDFEKYARFICGHFDISIELDSTKAQTNGKVINLPNVVGLNDDELDMMYAILLHEVGHIKHSSFSEEDFAKLRTQAHAFLANAIEDARIENLLMKEFAGAKDMFDKLYTEHVLNKQMMRKIFKFSGQRPDIFSSLGLFIHNQLVNCDTAPIEKLTTLSNAKKIHKFVEQYNLDTLLINSNLKNFDDVVMLTNKIYDLFVQHFKDKSDKTSFAADLALKQKVEKELQLLQDSLAQNEEVVRLLEEMIKEQKQKKLEWEIENFDKLNAFKYEIQKLESQNSTMERILNNRQKLEKAKTNLANKEKSISNNEEKLSKLKKDLEQLKIKAESGVSPKGKQLSEDKLEAAKKTLASKNAQLTNLEQKIAMDKKKLEPLKEDLKAADNFDKYTYENLSNQDLKDSIDYNTKFLNKEKENLRNLESEISEINNAINQAGNEINALYETEKNKILEQMYSLDSEALNSDIPISLLPEFIETPGWPEADEVQKQMDTKFSKDKKELVRNGAKVAGFLGSNLRDLGVYVDKKAHSVKEVNLLDIFKEKVDFSLLPELNEAIQVNKMTTDKSIRSNWSSLEKHTVLTTQFDKITQDNVSRDRTLVSNLLMTNQLLVKQVNKVFLEKFKFTKKDFFRGGKEDGQLDTRNLWKLATERGDDYFEVNHHKYVNKMAASILIDVSGSHSKSETDYGKNLQLLSLLLSEGLKGVHVNHEILGYHAPVNDSMREANAAYTYNRRSNALETFVYKGFKQKDNTAISNIEIQPTDNSDGESLRIAVNRLKRENAKSKVLFVITDGKPFLSDGNIVVLDEDLKAALREAVKNKIQVFAFGFYENGKDFYGDRFCHIKNWSDVPEFIKRMAV